MQALLAHRAEVLQNHVLLAIALGLAMMRQGNAKDTRMGNCRGGTWGQEGTLYDKVNVAGSF